MHSTLRAAAPLPAILLETVRFLVAHRLDPEGFDKAILRRLSVGRNEIRNAL